MASTKAAGSVGASSRTPLRAHGTLAGDVAKALGVGVQTLHYYEREGLIPAPPRSEGGYRLYTPEIVDRVGFIRRAQALGLPLDEIRDVLLLAEQGTSPCGRVQRALAGKLAEVDRRLRELRNFRNELAALVQRSANPTTRERRNPTTRICAIVEEASMPATADRPRGSVARGRRRDASR